MVRMRIILIREFEIVKILLIIFKFSNNVWGKFKKERIDWNRNIIGKKNLECKSDWSK